MPRLCYRAQYMTPCGKKLVAGKTCSDERVAVLLHRLWVTGEVYEPLRNSPKAMLAAA